MPDGMEQVLDSARKIVNRWANTQVPLIQDVNPGDTVIYVKNNFRFFEGDEVSLRNPISSKGEISLSVEAVQDYNIVILSSPAKYKWTVSDNCVLQKTFDHLNLKRIFLGEPENFNTKDFPCVVVKASSGKSEWFTLRNTKETYNLDLTVYSLAASQEDGYRSNIRISDTISYGLKKNLYPLVGPYKTSALIASAHIGDSYIKVYDVASLKLDQGIKRAIIEDEYKQAELWIEGAIDNQTIKLSEPLGCDFLLETDPQLIAVKRFFFNSWPSDTVYGEVYKGTLLKAARITWFCQEQKIEFEETNGRETYMH